jgi:hypothetical protein
MSVSAASAQPIVNGPPIDPNQVFRAQPRPEPPPPPPIASSPPGPSGTVLQPPGRASRANDRVARCQHMAAVERVPRSKRGGYINNCMQSD